MARLSCSNTENQVGILARSGPLPRFRVRAGLHSNPRAHLPPFQEEQVRRIRKQDFGYLVPFRLGRRNGRCRLKTAKAGDPAHSAAFVNLRVALSHKSIRRLMSSPPPAVDFRAATTTRERMSAFEPRRGAPERPSWARTGSAWPRGGWRVPSAQHVRAGTAPAGRFGCDRPQTAIPHRRSISGEVEPADPRHALSLGVIVNAIVVTPAAYRGHAPRRCCAGFHSSRRRSCRKTHSRNRTLGCRKALPRAWRIPGLRPRRSGP